MPSVCVAAMAVSRAFTFGATIAIRREVLDSVGGFKSILSIGETDTRVGPSHDTLRGGRRHVCRRVQSKCAAGARTTVAADDLRGPSHRPRTFIRRVRHACGGHRERACRRCRTCAYDARDHGRGANLAALDRAQAGPGAVTLTHSSLEGHTYLRPVGPELPHAHGAVA
jgi:hypothetical protein